MITERTSPSSPASSPSFPTPARGLLSRRSFGALAALLVLASACSPGPAPVSQSPRDASSPTADEGTPPAVPAAPAAAAASSSRPQSPDAHAEHDHAQHDHAHHDQGAPPKAHSDHAAPAPRQAAPSPPAKPKTEEAATYVCPMHPEVTSGSPGVCPICNMKLVPKR